MVAQVKTNWNLNLILKKIEHIYDDYTKEGCEVLILGDFNTDLKRKNNHTKILQEFLINNNLSCGDIETNQTVKYTHKRKTETGAYLNS